ncbi:PLP-dependent aminotransferase family protein [Mycetocola zhadangensis]|uniref:aminotransferase-like domain-containing protein n=1 Tax=Mycetocola zhadangensis TaxID=1164595 RepID=UPI003A4D4BA0
MAESFAELIEDRSPRGIAAALARLINSGQLAPGDRLPTVRELGAELSVSPATVSAAWQALSTVGLIVSRGRSGSFVRQAAMPWLSPRMQRMAGYVEQTRLDLSRGTPDDSLLPALGPALSRLSEHATTFSYTDQPVIPALHRELFRAWPYPADAITVVDGALDGMSRALEQVVRFGDRVVIEDPTFPPFFDLLDSLGAVRIPVAIDEFGMLPAALAKALTSSPRAVVLQPRAHNPTGASMTEERARELAHVVATSRHASDAVVIEDDHSAGISTEPDVSLGMFLPGQVLHVRSFSKTHGPDLRIAALGGPDELVNRIVSRRMLTTGWTSRMVQTILVELLTENASVNAVNEARMVYFSRQKELAAALNRHGYHATLADGLNTWIPVHDERSALVQLSAAGIRVAGGTPYLSSPDAGSFVRVTAGVLSDEFDFVADALARVAVGV